MTTERWLRIQALFSEAVDTPPGRRGQWLREACEGDDDLLRNVESLLLAGEEAESFLEHAIQEAAVAVVHQRIGPYQLVRSLGRGGMGTVFLAVRADDEYQSKVAIKLIRTGLDSPDLRARFRSERQILANLDHPNIARLLDGGTTESGAPYVVMEFVEGKTILEYCGQEKLSTTERLKLFRKVCAAVESAHQHLVVHRDIKPGNVLVNADGEPKLLDFGIAKLLDEAQSPNSTQTHVPLLTPAYASPEQIRGEPVTTTTDVYSLGVLLYELLTGSSPYQTTTADRVAIERAVCEEEPKKPSAVLSADRQDQRRHLIGDLDNIVLMAMRKESAHRYASVGQLSEDIERYLNGYPILARQSSWSYRTGKFVRRHKPGVAASVGVLILIIGYGLSMAVLAARIASERDRAEWVSSFLVDIFRVSDPSESRGNTVTAREILDKGAATIDTDFDDQPLQAAMLKDVIGRVYQGLGLHDRAIPLLEDALSTRQRLSINEASLVAESMSGLAWSVEMKGRNADAERLYRGALALNREVLGDDHLDVAKSRENLAGLLRVQAKYDEAESLYREALALRMKRQGESHLDVAENLHDIAQVLHDTGRYAEAEPLFRRALSTRRAGLGEDHPEVADNMNNLALTLQSRGHYSQAESLFRESLALRRKVLGQEHPDVGNSLNNLALILDAEGKADEAESLFRQAITLRRKILGEGHQLLGNTMRNLGQLLHTRGEFEEAESLYRESLAIFRKRLGDEHPYIANGLHGLGVLSFDKGDSATGETLVRQALELRRKQLGDQHPRVADSMAALGRILRAKADFASAESFFRGAIEINQRTFGSNHPSLVDPLVGLGIVLSDKGQASEAEPLLREAIALARQFLPEGHWVIAQAESALGGCLLELKRVDEAQTLLSSSYPILKAKRGAHSRLAAEVHRLLSTLDRRR